MSVLGRTMTGLAVLVLLIVMTACNEEPQPVSADPPAEATVTVELDRGVIQEMRISTEKSNAATVYPSLSCVPIAYDMSHNTGRQALGRPTSPSSVYTTIFGDYAARGATMTEIFTFDLPTLANYAVLWLEEDFNAVLTPPEMAALQAYVMAGGGVIISGDQWSPPAPFTAFGFGYTGGATGGVTTNITTHPVTNGVNAVTLSGAQAGLTVPPTAIPLVKEMIVGYPYVAIYRYGLGKVVVVTDELFENLVVNSTHNRVLGNNLMTFLIIQHVAIDIHPGSDPNSINCTNMNGVIPVALLSTPVFDATQVDHTTVSFQGAAETHVDKKTGLPRRHVEDVNGDGLMDLVFHFRFGDTNLDCNSTMGHLIGHFYCGRQIGGWDYVNMVP